ncbi:hypothetical protein GGI26_003401 [Coemansia sp. RSA 1358]|uniref:Uncharacterized protein n=1 Tax=Coemansia umbellata TaxID=1424467 RepID=A0ABQ8PMS3_9FUNG|nr:hypothetical protein EDC05_002869 [Coemansia umbellata]KAJ2622248.1 hypothetical protein GGI26_003401 [Coemansia sp. RSA 1358]
MAELVCKGPTNTDTNDSHRQWDQTGQCYAAVFAAETARESNLLANGGTAEEYACNSCTKEWNDACCVIKKGYIGSFAVGLSVYPAKHTFIRELYQFEYRISKPKTMEKFKGKSLLYAGTRLCLNRFVSLLKSMEPLSGKLGLVPSAPKNFVPPSFLPVDASQVEPYSILPQFGNAKIGKAENGNVTLYMRAFCVEGPVQVPPLGSTLCSRPAILNINELSTERLFIAASNDKLHEFRTRSVGVKPEADLYIESVSNDCSNPIISDTSAERHCECRVSMDEEMPLLMDSMRDTSSFGGLWRPTEHEQRAYTHLLKFVDPNNEGIVRGQLAVPFLQKSGLSDAVLGGVWQLADADSKGHLTAHEFSVAMKLISLAQSQRPVSLNNLKDDVPLPDMKGIDITQLTAIPSSSQPRRDSTASGSGWSSLMAGTSSFDEGAGDITIMPKEKLQYKQIFEKNQPVDGAISGASARALFTKTKLNAEQLSKVWALGDPHAEGKLRLPGFIVAMYYIRRIMENRNFELPTVCPVSLWRSAGGDVPLRSPLANMSQSSLASMPTSDLSNARWDVAIDERKRYDQFFKSLDQGHLGYLAGDVPVNFFLKSRLPEAHLSKIWELSDINHSGKLSRDEFAVAMHLINSKLAGNEIPDKLPATLVPPSMRKATIASNSMHNLSPPLRPGSARDNLQLQGDLKRTNSYAAAARSGVPTGISRASTSRSPKPLSPVPDDTELTALQNQLGQLEDFSHGLQAQRTATANQLALASSRKQELEIKISALQSAHDAETRINQELQEKLKAEEAQVSALQSQVAEAAKRLTVVSAQRSQLEQDIHRVQTRQLALQQNLRQAQEDAQQLHAEIGGLEQQKRHLEQVIAVAESQVKQQVDANSVLSERANGLRNEVAALSEKAAETAATSQTNKPAAEQESLSFDDIFGTSAAQQDSFGATTFSDHEDEDHNASNVNNSLPISESITSGVQQQPQQQPQQQQEQQPSAVFASMPSFGPSAVATSAPITSDDAFASFGVHSDDPFEEFLQSTAAGPRPLGRSATVEPSSSLRSASVGPNKHTDAAKTTSDPRSVTSTPAPNVGASFSQGFKSTPASPFVDKATIAGSANPPPKPATESSGLGFAADFSTAFGVLPSANARTINQDLENFESKFPDISKLSIDTADIASSNANITTSAKEDAAEATKQHSQETKGLTFESVFGSGEDGNKISANKAVEDDKPEGSVCKSAGENAVAPSSSAFEAAPTGPATEAKSSKPNGSKKDNDDDFVPPPVVKRTNVSARPMSRVLSIFRSSSNNRNSVLSSAPAMPRRTTAEKREQLQREQDKRFEEQWAKGDWPDWVKNGEYFHERKMLTEMGYSKDRVVEALEVNDFNLAQATDYLLSS